MTNASVVVSGAASLSSPAMHTANQHDPRHRLRAELLRRGIAALDDGDVLAAFDRSLARRLGEFVRHRTGEHGIVELLDAHAAGRSAFNRWLRRAVPGYPAAEEHILDDLLGTIDRPEHHVLRNLTGHPVAIHTPHGVLRMAPDDVPARCADDDLTGEPPEVITAAGVPVVVLEDCTGTGVRNLPEPRPHILLIVSRMVAYAQPDRTDLVFPHGLLKDAAGHTRGCRALTRPRRRCERHSNA